MTDTPPALPQESSLPKTLKIMRLEMDRASESELVFATSAWVARVCNAIVSKGEGPHTVRGGDNIVFHLQRKAPSPMILPTVEATTLRVRMLEQQLALHEALLKKDGLESTVDLKLLLIDPPSPRSAPTKPEVALGTKPHVALNEQQDAQRAAKETILKGLIDRCRGDDVNDGSVWLFKLLTSICKTSKKFWGDAQNVYEVLPRLKTDVLAFALPLIEQTALNPDDEFRDEAIAFLRTFCAQGNPARNWARGLLKRAGEL